MLEKYRPAVDALSPTEGTLLWTRLEELRLVDEETKNVPLPSRLNGQMFDRLAASGLCQADLVMALLPDNSYTARNAVEKLVGKPITVVSAPAVPDSALATIRLAVAEQLQGDQRRFRDVIPNPRRPGCLGHERFSKLRDGMKVVEFYKAGGRRSDIRKGLREGWFTLEDPE
jgi:hypothetical protein